MKGWTLDDIAWNRFQANLVDPDTVKVVKAAALVEHNGWDYAAYLKNVFRDDPGFCAATDAWAAEEVRHGQALRRWAELADPTFDFDHAFHTFVTGYRLPLDAQESVRGSRAGELIARCIVESGTSSWYTAIKDGSNEPVLQQICAAIAADELRHYKLFYETLKTYLQKDGLGRWERLRVAATRLTESEDDELAYAYYAANGTDVPYDRKTNTRAYARRAYAFYRPHHVDRFMAMIFKAVGLTPRGLLHQMAAKAVWKYMAQRTRMLVKTQA